MFINFDWLSDINIEHSKSAPGSVQNLHHCLLDPKLTATRATYNWITERITSRSLYTPCGGRQI